MVFAGELRQPGPNPPALPAHSERKAGGSTFFHIVRGESRLRLFRWARALSNPWPQGFLPAFTGSAHFADAGSTYLQIDVGENSSHGFLAS